MPATETTADRLRIPHQPQRQDSLADQLRDLHIIAARCGMYDAADWLWKQSALHSDGNDRTSDL